MLQDRRRQYDDRMLITLGIKTSGYSHALAFAACQYKPLMLTMADALTNSNKKHPARLGAGCNFSRLFSY